MARKDKPYLPLYVQDFMTDEKLIECSASATGVYIRLMCILHKQEIYGQLLLKQNDKQTDNQIQNFASKLARQMPYAIATICDGIIELSTNGVVTILDDILRQKRMYEDGMLSEVRSNSGSKGGKKTQKFAKAKRKANNKAKQQANADIEIEDDNTLLLGGTGVKTWRNDFETYMKECREGYKTFVEDKKLISDQERLNPGIDILLSIEKGFHEFWGTEDGWNNKKGKKTKNINWKTTIMKSIKFNKTYLPK